MQAVKGVLVPGNPLVCDASSMSDDDYVQLIMNVGTLKDSTKRPYVANLKTISKYVGGVPLSAVLADADRYYGVIRDAAMKQPRYAEARSPHGSLSTVKTLIKTLLSVLKYSCGTAGTPVRPDAYARWQKIFAELGSEIDRLADNNAATTTYMDWGAALERERILRREAYGSLEHATLALYTLIPPRRQHDYWKLATDPGTDSAEATGVLNLRARPATIFIRAFKNVDTHDVYSAELPEELAAVLKTYIASKAGRASHYLFTKMNGDPYGSLNSFTDANNTVLKRALANPHASVNTLRHACATYVNTNPHMLREEKKRYADAMSHSFAQQQLYVVATPSPVASR